MQEGNNRAGQVRFGVFEVDLLAGELRKHGMQVRLQEQPFRVLAMMLEHPGDLVKREDLRKRLWPEDIFVDFDHGLNKAVNKIRDALGDSAESPRYVETVPRRGYRFLAEVRTVEDPQEPSGKAGPARRKTSVISPAWERSAAVVAVVCIILLASGIYVRSRRAPAIRSLAVLPLESLAGDRSQDYFADGMTDELITDLGQISALRVISRTSVMSYKGVRKPLPQIARELGVDAIVEGTVLRSGNRVRITAQLIEARADKHLWADSYEGNLGNTLAVQSEVARAIANQIQVKINPTEQAALMNVKAVNPEAYESYLKGRYFWNKRTADGLKAAVAYFEQAINEDPNYARAYAGLADTYALLGDWQYAAMTPKEALPKAKAAALKALELDDTLGEAHNSLAFCLDGFDWDFAGAGKEFERAIALSPGYATAHHWYAWHLALIGKDDEAIGEMKKSQSLDPLSLIINADLAELLVLAHQNDEAIEQSRQTIEMDANFALAHNQLAQAYLQENRNEEAVAELQKAVQLSGGSPNCMANLARAYVASGKRNEAEKLLGELKRGANSSYSRASEIAVVYAALGDKKEAMTWLEKGYVERFNPGVLLRPGFDAVRETPEFQDLLRRIGLDD